MENEDDAKKLKEEKTQLQQDLEKFKRLAVLQHKQIEDLKSSSDPNQIHQKDIEQWKAKASELMKAAASMKVKMGQLQFKTKSLETDLSQATKERDNLKNLYELAKQNGIAQTVQMEIDDIKRKYEEYKVLAAKKIMEYRVLEQKAVAIDKEAKLNKQEVERLKALLQNPTNNLAPSSPSGGAREIAKLKQNLEEVSSELAKYQELESSTANTIDQLNTAILTLKKEKDELTRKVNASQGQNAEISRLKEEIDRYEKILALEREKFATSRPKSPAQSPKDRPDTIKLREQLELTNLRYDQLQQQLQIVQKERDDVRTDLDKMRVELKRSKEEIDKLIQLNTTAQAKFEKLQLIADQTLSAAEEKDSKLKESENQRELMSKEIDELRQQLSHKVLSPISPKTATPPGSPATLTLSKVDTDIKRENESLRKELALEKGKFITLQKEHEQLKLMTPGKVSSTPIAITEFVSPGPSSQGLSEKMFHSHRLLPSQQLIWIVHVLSFQLDSIVKSIAKGKMSAVQTTNLQNKESMNQLRAICNGLPKSMKTSQLTAYFQLILQLESEKEALLASSDTSQNTSVKDIERNCMKLEEVFNKIIASCCPLAEKIYFNLEITKETIDSLVVYARGGKNPARVKYYESKVIAIISQTTQDLKILSGRSTSLNTVSSSLVAIKTGHESKPSNSVEFWGTAKTICDAAQKAVYLLHLEQKAKIPQVDVKDELKNALLSVLLVSALLIGFFFIVVIFIPNLLL